MESYERLEIEWATWNGLDPKGMVCCASGTAALHLALEALQLPTGSEVVTGDFSMISVPRAISMAGHKPVFVDCDERLLMNWDCFVQYRNSTAKALVAVHIYGRREDPALIESAEDYHHEIVEDLAEAHGVRPHPSSGAACWSFYQNKIIAGQEGGAVWFRDPEHAALARKLRCLGFTDAHNFWHLPRGHNYRMSNANAQLIRLSLLDADGNIERRREVEALYNGYCPKEWRMPPRDAPWVYDLRLPGASGVHLDAVVQRLQKAGIPARHGFKPCHLQTEYTGSRFITDVKGTEKPRSLVASEQVLYLPLTPGMVNKRMVEAAFEILEPRYGTL